MFILFSKIGFGQTSGDTIKIETKNKAVLIINKQTVDNWDFEAEIEQKRIKNLVLNFFTVHLAVLKESIIISISPIRIHLHQPIT